MSIGMVVISIAQGMGLVAVGILGLTICTIVMWCIRDKRGR